MTLIVIISALSILVAALLIARYIAKSQLKSIGEDLKAKDVCINGVIQDAWVKYEPSIRVVGVMILVGIGYTTVVSEQIISEIGTIALIIDGVVGSIALLGGLFKRTTPTAVILLFAFGGFAQQTTWIESVDGKFYEVIVEQTKKSGEWNSTELAEQFYLETYGQNEVSANGIGDKIIDAVKKAFDWVNDKRLTEQEKSYIEYAKQGINEDTGSDVMVIKK